MPFIFISSTVLSVVSICNSAMTSNTGKNCSFFVRCNSAMNLFYSALALQFQLYINFSFLSFINAFFGTFIHYLIFTFAHFFSYPFINPIIHLPTHSLTAHLSRSSIIPAQFLVEIVVAFKRLRFKLDHVADFFHRGMIEQKSARTSARVSAHACTRE